MADPVSALAADGGVLGVVTGVEGSAYRPVGAAMAFGGDGRRVGSLSSGCIDAAVACEAGSAAENGQVRQLRYGRGSPFIDIRLPCGAGLDITLWPATGAAILAEAQHEWAARRAASLLLPRDGIGAARMIGAARAGWTGEGFVLPRIPPLRIEVFGTGVETMAFAPLAGAAGYDVRVWSPDEAVLLALPGARPLPRADGFPRIDPQTAVVLFFHDHDREMPVLTEALGSNAFWIGAQGSRRAQADRLAALDQAGVAPARARRLQDRIGLIPSARDPQTLAVSVLADVVGAYKSAWFDPFFRASGQMAAA